MVRPLAVARSALDRVPDAADWRPVVRAVGWLPPSRAAETKKADVVETRRYSTTSAYSSTSPPAPPGCPSSSHPTIINILLYGTRGGKQVNWSSASIGVRNGSQSQVCTITNRSHASASGAAWSVRPGARWPAFAPPAGAARRRREAGVAGGVRVALLDRGQDAGQVAHKPEATSRGRAGQAKAGRRPRRPQPGSHLGVAPAGELVTRAVCFEQGLPYNVGGIQLAR